ncbi:MAG: hypothetical protein HZA54_01355, partial [Planctomycetes bacterium]|nr:hypothetical protein [Planctomycetota bacterium]
MLAIRSRRLRESAGAVLFALLLGLAPAAHAQEAPPPSLRNLPDEDSAPLTTVEVVVSEHRGADPGVIDRTLDGVVAECQSQAERLKSEHDRLAMEQDADPSVVEAARDALALAQERENLLRREVGLVRDLRALEELRRAVEKSKTELADAEGALEKFLTALGSRRVEPSEAQIATREAVAAESEAEEARKASDAAAAEAVAGQREVDHYTIHRKIRRAEHKQLIESYSAAAGREKQQLQRKLGLLVERIRLLQEYRSFMASRLSYLSSQRDLSEVRVRRATRAAALARRKADALGSQLARQSAAEEMKSVEEERARLAEESRRLTDALAAAPAREQQERLGQQQFNLQIRQRINEVRGLVAKWKKQRGEFQQLSALPRREAILLDRAALKDKPLDAEQFIERKKALDQEIGQNNLVLEGLAEALKEAKARLESLKGEREPALATLDVEVKCAEAAKADAASIKGSPEERSR